MKPAEGAYVKPRECYETPLVVPMKHPVCYEAPLRVPFVRKSSLNHAALKALTQNLGF